ncbi:shikimate kinase AroK [Chromobacterium violaceum]|uniref:Shikimate kinase n=3 Tax=Chromobacterium violaceum TaxID=536 RepID=AROK_CHRVO|nr:shikimate kinase AroK [Chromobacterium violaceum]Q7NZU3.1 RecName: Full=Shikimate kinase; Short=SK [Chromobacterium violaceum ATCC 12472]AAQ58503.1 shikimate kinase [Chromobacterium violaceum ATCC 12472]ATP27607.1 shikimate kinase AroK [Chromobacterium violaceum]ATP31520.1 shikimate kinase AroK [Chromobacterium violaceum]MBA8734177.1 shikimate kinase AroK [Chromobacterium violaceum]MBP4044642.1 shikimate kinase AroK [Chromobacterium violaceum]
MPAMEKLAGNFFLVGLMGAGKTTVGRALARRTGKTFYDSDQEIEARTGVRVATIFDIEGEMRFRNREACVIRDLAQQRDIVLATGGGAVLREENRKVLASHGTVIYLRASIDDLLARTQHDKNRPLLQIADPRAKLESLFNERDPFYREIADIIIDTTQQNVNLLVGRLVDQLLDSPHHPKETD